ncbi:MAG: winged helix-turn-helix transcriptional regulator [Spirochaetaceae bacterium]|nr:MAG: winged helix-turn-helix transcriptional regulator [Spirochaetaceae bacterium]
MEKIIRRLFRFRWNVSILAELSESEGSKFITLVVRLGISRGVLSSTLEQLLSDGLVSANPGYGHPLRPEYILTESGKIAAAFCRELLRSVGDRGENYLLQSKWALPVLFAIGGDELRFGELKNRLAPVTSRALSEELKKLMEMGVIDRKILGEFPPVAIYASNPRGRHYVWIYERHGKALRSLPDGRQ